MTARGMISCAPSAPTTRGSRCCSMALPRSTNVERREEEPMESTTQPKEPKTHSGSTPAQAAPAQGAPTTATAPAPAQPALKPLDDTQMTKMTMAELSAIAKDLKL